MFCPKPIRLKPAFFDIFCFFGRIFLEKNAVFCIFCCFASFFLGKNRLFSYAWMSSLFAPYKNAVLFAYCDPPSHPFSSKNLFSAHVPRGSQKAPRNFAESLEKAFRKVPRGLPEGFQNAPRRLPEGSQTLQRSSQKVPRRLPDASTRLPERFPKGSKKLPEAPRRSQKAPSPRNCQPPIWKTVQIWKRKTELLAQEPGNGSDFFLPESSWLRLGPNWLLLHMSRKDIPLPQNQTPEAFTSKAWPQAVLAQCSRKWTSTAGRRAGKAFKSSA